MWWPCSSSGASNGGQKEDMKLQCSQLRYKGEHWHISIGAWRLIMAVYSESLGPFLTAALPMKVEASAWTMAADGKTKTLHHQGEFQHQNYKLGSAHDSDHDGIVRVFVGQLFRLNIHTTKFSLYQKCNYAAQFSLYQECNYLFVILLVAGTRACLSWSLPSTTEQQKSVLIGFLYGQLYTGLYLAQ